MSSQPNRLHPTTTAFTMLRRGWKLTSPDDKFLIFMVNNSVIDIYLQETGVFIASYPLTANGFEQMMNEVVNPPF